MLFFLFIKNNVVLICSPVNGMDEHIHERNVQLAGLKTAC